MGSSIRFFTKLFVFLTAAAFFFLQSAVLYFAEPKRGPREIKRNQLSMIYCRFFLHAFGITLVKPDEANTPKTALVIANHLGFIDAVIMGSIRPMTFITSVDMGETPIVGTIARIAGCIFVERRSEFRSREQIQKDQNKLVRAFRSGRSILLFPEGTSTLGDRVLPFKTGMIRAAQVDNIPVLTYAICYENAERYGVTKEMSLAKHIWNVFSSDEIKVQVKLVRIDDQIKQKEINKAAEEYRQDVQNALIA